MSVSKKLLSVFLAFTMLLIAIPLYGINSFASDPADFSYTVISEDEKTAEISGYEGSDSEIVVPSQIDGYTITDIGMFAFQSGYDSNNDATRIVFPSTIHSISSYSLVGVPLCTEFYVPSDNQYYSTLNGVLFNKNFTELLKYPGGKTGSSYSVPGTVTNIGFMSFALCSNLQSVTLPNSVTEIDGYGFAYCMSMESIDIPSSVTTINSSAFAGCSSLSSIILREGLESIYMDAFSGCSSLEEILLPSSLVFCEDNPFGDSSLITVYGTTGSYAETFASDNGYTFVDMSALTPGDINNDNLCNYKDIDTLVQIAAGIILPTAIQTSLGDLNNDGVIDGFDVAALDRFVYKDID